ncbi:hypothetical protein ACFQNE_10545 [Gordonia phosphorivorans]|uniref:Uncharacterized protein n=1 Tax=Gordonia phosphorivorans TaxID=1056982 RepID=A0ABV6H9D8_9ACTN
MTSSFDDQELEAYYALIEGRTAARERPRRRRPKAVTYTAPACPTPEKIAYPTLAAVTGAILAISASSRASPSLRSYECSCGAWHLTRSYRC